MSDSPFKPPEDPSVESMDRTGPVGVPPIVIREPGDPVVTAVVRRAPFQFSLRSLLLAVTGVSVIASLTAWLGLVFLMVMMMLGGLITVYAGTYLLDSRLILAGGMLMFIAAVVGPIVVIIINVP